VFVVNRRVLLCIQIVIILRYFSLTMSVSKRLELLDHLSELIATIHDNTIRLKYLCDSNQEYVILDYFDIENL